VLLLSECFLLLFISLSTQSGIFWLHPRIFKIITRNGRTHEQKEYGKSKRTNVILLAKRQS